DRLRVQRVVRSHEWRRAARRRWCRPGGALAARSARQGPQKLIQLIERFVKRLGCSGSRGVERFLRWIPLVNDQVGSTVALLEGDGGDGSVLTAFLIRP